MDIKSANRILIPIEKILLDGEKFPNGRACGDWENKRDKKLENLLASLVEFYDSFNKSEDEISKELKNRIFYLARHIRPKDCYTINIEDSKLSQEIVRIAEQGRDLSLINSSDVDTRIKDAHLYIDSWGNKFAAQLRDPKRGCSASICTNCNEPIAFCDYTCDTCNYELIGAHGMPKVEDWNKMDVALKITLLKIGYTEMIEDIRQRGDWRGAESPLNRFKYN